MEAQIEQAVAAAMSPTADSSLKSQAITFIQQVKDSPQGWDLCLALFVRQPRSTQEARMFALQVVEDALRPSKYNIMEVSSRQGIQRTFMEYINQEYVQSSDTSDPPFIRNKFAHALTLLFVHTYTTTWTSFFQDLLSLIHTNVSKSNGSLSQTRTNEAAVDLLLRVLLSIDEEVADVMIPRQKSDLQRNTTIKDAIRGSDIKSLVSKWYDLMLEYRDSNLEIVETCLKVVAQYIAWIDISLIVNDSYMRLILEYLKVNQLRNAACQILIEIVCKGIPLREDKFNLINALNLPRIISELDFADDEEFVEQVAKLVNFAGVELVRVYLDVSLDLQASVYPLIERFLQFMLRFLGDDYDDTSSAVFPFATEYIALLKKARGQRNENPLLDSQVEFLSSFIRVVTRKMQYDAEWSDDPDPEDVAMFAELRQKLKSFHDSVYVLDAGLFISITHNLMHEILEKYMKMGPAGVPWAEAELCLHLLYIQAEVSKSPPQYFKNAESNPTLTPLAELIVKTIQSNISAYPHNLIAAQYFELVTRYYQFFEVRPDLIPTVLEAFLDERGCHHPKESHRARVWYLFQRFIKSARSRLKSFEEQILRSLEDLLVVRAELPPPDPAGDDSTPASAVNYGLFDSQLYLFEAVGMLVSSDVDSADKRSDLLLLVLNPLMSSMQRSLLPANFKADDPLFVLQIHHLIMAVGNIAKSFRTYSKGVPGQGPPAWSPAFKEAAETIISALQALTRFEIIRDATRFAFARLVTCVGPIIIPTIPPLINGLLAECKPTELIDFLPFLALIMHKYKDDIKPMINDLFLPLVNRIFYILQQPATGTDDTNMQADLRKGYLNFVHSLFTYGIESILISDTNRPHLEPIIQNIFSYAMDTSDGSTEKAAFALVTKMVLTWGSGNKANTNSNGVPGKTKKDAAAAASRPSSPLPGFDRLIYDHLVPMCFEIPSKPTFDLGDAETQLVLAEIAALQKAIYDKLGSDAVNFLSGVYFPRINCPPELATEYLHNLQQLEGKQFKVFFTKFIRQSRGTS